MPRLISTTKNPACGPDPMTPHPLGEVTRVGFLKPLVNDPLIDIGEYTYYDDPQGPERFFENCVLYRHPDIGDRLTIGRFCAIAMGVQFIMNAANHPMTGLSTYPFSIFGNGWEDPDEDWRAGLRGDTVIGNDVWIGMGATIMPGVTVGDGAIIGTRAVVASDVPAYGVAVGAPARTIRQRFDPDTIERLLRIKWWNWPAEKITQRLGAIRRADIDALERDDWTAA